MTTLYTLWDADTRNMLTAAHDLAAVLSYVRKVVQEYGASATEHWGMIWEDEDDEDAGGLLAEGSQLADLALRTPLPDSQSSGREKLAS